MDNVLYLLSGELRAVAHLLNYSEYIRSVTHDEEFEECLKGVIAGYLNHASNECIETIKE